MSALETETVRERPILFSGAMVRAILAGRKTQTRRVARFTGAGYLKEPGGHRRWHRDDPDAVLACPHGQPGDALWVRETWFLCESNPNGLTVAKYAVDDDEAHWRVPQPEQLAALSNRTPNSSRARSGRFMPRWASRITLRITGVRVERLHNISEADARAEGIESVHVTVMHLGEKCGGGGVSARARFGAAWDTINGKRAPWASNPWVWVVSFEEAGRVGN